MRIYFFDFFFFRTALAEAELEYRDDHQSKSVYVKLPVIDSSK
jgi:isoleucyl-tRNA synthetase